MPPRRSCFADTLQRQRRNIEVSMPPRRSCFHLLGFHLLFQCHHGVPASLRRCKMAKRFYGCFNATTAFLLRHLPALAIPARDRFNATTAFLLRDEGEDDQSSQQSSFNATTAFLLRDQAAGGNHERKRFQCHHGVPASHCCLLGPPGAPLFQCHHGVPASEHRRDPDRIPHPFQCHHGVPASLCPPTRIAIVVYVSMPPRRSCFSF